MAIWTDPVLPQLDTPSVDWLKEHPIRFGKYDAVLSPNQWEMTFCTERFPAWVGGTRCVAAETMISDVPVAELSRPLTVDTLIGPRPASASFLKARATALYRVTTKSQREVVVSLGHQFLTPDGWRSLRALDVGALIAGRDTDRAPLETGIGEDSTGRCSAGSRPYDGLPSPLTAYNLDRFRQSVGHGTSSHGNGPRLSRMDSDSHACELSGELSRLASRVADEASQGLRRNHEQPETRCQNWTDSAGLSQASAVDECDAFRFQREFHFGSECDSPWSGLFQGGGQYASGSGSERNPLGFGLLRGRATYWLDSFLHSNTFGYWDEIVSIAFVKYGDVYDLTVDDAHHYIAHGLVHHNSGKTLGGVFRGLKYSLFIPGNRGIVGRLTQTDLQDTTQRDFYEMAEATGMVKKKNDRELVLYNCDTAGRMLKNDPTAEVLFLHFDNPNHLKGHGIGWFWMDEGSEMSPKSFYRLVDRLSHPAAAGKYTGFVTSNPEGRNWIFDEWYNADKVQAKEKDARLMRRGIHNRTKDNPFLTEEYLKMQYAMSPPDWIRRYMDGEFDVFEGQIWTEFSYDIHCINSRQCSGWEGHEPPKQWVRLLGIDTGGVDPWAFEAAAVDPWGNIIFYDEIYRPEVYVGSFEKETKTMIEGRNFVKFPMDWENKTAQEELRRIGIRVTNAFKRNKLDSIQRMARYLHPNPLRAYPEWHPKAGQPGSPGIFFTERVPNLVSEVPQQRWKKIQGYDLQVNEPDPKVANHATDASLYVLRERPKPEEALVSLGVKYNLAELDKRSAYFKMLEIQNKQQNKPVNPMDRIYPHLRQKEVRWSTSL